MSILTASRANPPVRRNADQDLHDNIEAASTFAELKAALLGDKPGATAQIAARPSGGVGGR